MNTPKKPNDAETEGLIGTTNPSEMSAGQKRSEVTGILAAGLRRLRKSEQSPAGSQGTKKKVTGDVRNMSLTSMSAPRTLMCEDMLADRWLCSASRLQRWRTENIGPPYLKIGGKILYRLCDVEVYETSCRVNPRSASGRSLKNQPD